jgi:hypothetical protein
VYLKISIQEFLMGRRNRWELEIFQEFSYRYIRCTGHIVIVVGWRFENAEGEELQQVF